MSIRGLVTFLVCLVVFMGAVYPAYSEQTLEQLRNLQDQEYAALRKEYDDRALNIDKNNPESSKALANEYSAKRAEIRQKYSTIDTRAQNLNSTLNDPKVKGRINNTGSMPSTVNADVDVAGDAESVERLAKDWSKKGGKKPLYYTVDNPTVPTTTPPKDFSKVIKVVNPNTDTTAWTPETEEIRKAKVKDPDAWTTSGGQKATGNIERSRDKRGNFLDNEKKFNHSDRPVQSAPGIHDEDLKTFSKSVSKAGGKQGANIAKDNPQFYDQASKMQKYGDPVEAGIVDLGDSPEVRKQKIEAWKQTAREEMKKAKVKSQKLGDAADTAREDLAQQMRDQGNNDVANRIEKNRQDVANSNRDAADENKKLKAESEELRNNSKKQNTADIDDSALDGPSKGKQSDVEITTNTSDDVLSTKKPTVTVDSDVDLTPGKKKPVQMTKIDVDAPNSKKNLDVDGGIDVLEAVETVGQVFQSGTRVAGDAIDENRDLNSDDAAEVVKDLTPGVREYEATKEALENRRVESLERQERIRQLKDKNNLTLDEKLELNNLEHEAKSNPDTAAGDAAGLFTDKVQSYEDELNQRKKDQGREGEKDDFVKDGLPMAGAIAKDVADMLNPLTPIAEALPEIYSWEKRQAWASQKDTLTKYLNSEAIKIEKNTQRNTDKLNQLLTTGDLSDPEVQKKIDALLATLKQDRDKLTKLNAVADAHLQEVNPEELKYVRRLKDGLPDINSLEDWRNQLTKDQAEAESCPENTVRLSDENDKIQCASCDVLHSDFNVAIGANEKNYAQALLDLSVGCGWIAEGTKKIANYGNCPDDTVRLSDESDAAQCVPCTELYGDFNAAIERNDKGYAQTLLEIAPNCGWVAAGKEKLHRARDCPGNTVKLSDESDTVFCVPCAELRVDFDFALSGGDKEYAQSLIDLAPNCGWTLDGKKDIEAAGKCPVNTVKLNGGDGQNQCVPCDELYGDFNAALSSGDRPYAETLANLGSSCGWSKSAVTALSTPQSCPNGTVKLSDQSNEIECVPCETLYGDFIAAKEQGETSYAESLVDLASSCSWSQSVAQQMYSANQQADFDQKCNQLTPGSHAVINGDQYTCYCNEGMLILTGSNGTSCQSCEQVRGYINSALRQNNLGNVRGLMAGAQNCGWYDEAVQVVAGIAQQQKDQAIQQRNKDNQQIVNNIKNLVGGFMNQQGGNSKPPNTGSPPQRPPKKVTPKPSPPKKAPPKKQPAPPKQSPDGCAGGRCCTGHQLYCKQRGTEYSYPRTSLDRNTDWICDICKRPFKTKQGRLAPGLRGAQRGDVSCRH